MDFGVGGADLNRLRDLFLRPDVAKVIPEMILDHTYWSYGRGRHYGPNDHSGNNRHLHIGIDRCVHLPVSAR